MNTQKPNRNATTDEHSTSSGNPESDSTPAVDRRTLLKTVGLGAAMGTAGCQDVLGGMSENGGGGESADEHVPFDVWREVRAALRTSPDHLPARAKELVAKSDPEALFEFVRDEIVTYPAEADRLETYGDVMRWGVRGTLRGGAGTPREKAELLADLYRRAGWESEVLIGSGLETPEQTKRLLWRPGKREFAPDIDEAKIEEWQERVGQSSNGEQSAIEAIDKGGEESRRLGKQLFEQLPIEELSPREFNWDTGDLPIVRVVVDGTEHYVDLFALDTPFGELNEEVESLEPPDDPSETLPVEVTLSAATADAPEEPFDLVSGTWNADELVGRQLLVQTLPGIDPLKQPSVTFQDVQTFIPALTVQAMDLNQKAMTDLSVMGDAVTRSGDRLQAKEGGAVTRNGEPFVKPDAGAATADVTELKITTDSGRFPEMRLNVHALDAAGKPVEGLPATAFEVSDEDQPVGVSMTANERAPRVLILSDESGSMPNRYTGETMDKLVTRLRKRISSEYPNAQINHEFRWDNLWGQLSEAAGTDTNVVVYITDGESTDESTDETKTALRQGPPTIFLNVNEEKPPSDMKQITDLNGGTVNLAGDHAAAEATILDYLTELVPKLPTYTLTYGSPAPPDISGNRRVTVGIADSDAEASGSYRIPDSAALPPHLAGLYLTTSVDGQEVTRTLAGYDPIRNAKQPATRAMVDEVTGALFGNHTLSFEAAAPSPSVWFNDVLTAKLSVADLDEAVVEEDSEKIDRALEAGFSFIQPEFRPLTGELPEPITDQSLTFQQGLRVVLYQERPVFGEQHVVKHADLLPFADFTTVAADPEEGFRLTMEKTARLAVVESAIFETSTRSLLAEESVNEYRTIDSSVRETWPEAQAKQWGQWFYQRSEYRGLNLIPVDGRPFTFWNVDKRTGELLGVLPDGSGGGSTPARICNDLKQSDIIITMYSMVIDISVAVAALNSVGAFSLGVVALYGQLLTRLYAAASLAIATMDNSKLDEQVRMALASFACNVARSIMFVAIGEWVDDAIGNLFIGIGDKSLSVVGASPGSCPSGRPGC